MQRSIVWALGFVLAAGAGVATAGSSQVVRAGQKTDGDPGAKHALTDEGDGPRVVRRVEVRRMGAGGYLGVTLAEIDRDDAARLKLDAERGARVTDVGAGTPAARAGVKTDDVIVKFDGEEVRSAMQLARLVHETPAGRSVELELVRDGRSQGLSVELGRPRRELAGTRDLEFELPEAGELPELGDPPDAPDARAFGWRGGDLPRLREFHRLLGPPPPQRLGLSYQEIAGQMARYFRLEGERGVLVVEVAEDGPAARAGVKAGDVILGFEGRRIEDGSDLREALRGTEAGQSATLELWRDGRSLELKVTLGGETRRPRPGATT